MSFTHRDYVEFETGGKKFKVRMADIPRDQRQFVRAMEKLGVTSAFIAHSMELPEHKGLSQDELGPLLAEALADELVRLYKAVVGDVREVVLQ